MLEALRQQRVAVAVHFELVRVHRLAKSHDLEHRAHPVSVAAVVHFGRVEVRHALAAEPASEQVLVAVQDRVDPCKTQRGDRLVDLAEVSVVVNAWSCFERFPEDPEADHVESFVLHELDVFCGQRGERVEVVGDRDVRGQLVSDVDPVEDQLPAVLVGRVLGSEGQSERMAEQGEDNERHLYSLISLSCLVYNRLGLGFNFSIIRFGFSELFHDESQEFY